MYHQNSDAKDENFTSSEHFKLNELLEAWEEPEGGRGPELPDHLAGRPEIGELDPFDRHQLAYVVGICRRSSSLSEAAPGGSS